MMSSYGRQSFNLPIFWHKEPWRTMCKKSRWGNKNLFDFIQFFLNLHPNKILPTLGDNIFKHVYINKNLAYGVCIYCSYIKLSLSAGENANHSCFNVTPTVCSFLIYFLKNAIHACTMQWTPVFQWFQQIPGILDTTVTINSKSGTLYTPYW